MTWHVLVHWLDDLRHEGASTLSWEAVKTNLGASVWQATAVVLLWPRLRKAIFAEVHASLNALHKHLGSKPPTQ